MSVYKPKKGRFWWFDFQLQGRRYTGSTGATTRSKAERVEGLKRVAAASGELDRPEKVVPTLSQAAATWWSSKSDMDSADQMLSRVNLAVQLVGPNKPVNEVTFSDIQTAIQKRRGMLTPQKKPPANATVNRDLIATLRPTIKLAKKRLNDGVGAPVAFPEIDWGELALAEPKPKPRDLTTTEQEALPEALPEHMRDFVRFQKRYACRLSEMFFKPADLDIEAARVRLRERKGDDDHVVPLAQEDLGWLAARKSRAEAAGLDTIWWRPPTHQELTRKQGRRLKPNALVGLSYTAACRTISKAMTTIGAREARGIRGSHSLRHTGIMRVMRDTNGNLRAAQRLAGHANIRSTMTYAHVLEDDLRAILDAQSQPAPEPAVDDATDSSQKALSEQKKA